MKTNNTCKRNYYGSKRSELSWRFPSSGQIQSFFSNEKKSVPFEYFGKSSLTVRGMITGRYYHFSIPGTVLEIDGRDASDMGAVPHLRAVMRD